MTFIDDLFKPVTDIEKGAKYVFDGTIAHPLDNVSSGAGNLFTGVGQGFSGLGYGVGQGFSGLGQGVGGLLNSPLLIIGGVVLVVMLANNNKSS